MGNSMKNIPLLVIFICLLCLASCTKSPNPKEPNNPSNPSEPNEPAENFWPVQISQNNIGVYDRPEIAFDPNNNIYVFGSVYDSKQESEQSRFLSFLVNKIDPQGNVIWSSLFPNDIESNPYGLSHPILKFGKDGEVYLYAPERVVLPQTGEFEKIAMRLIMKKLDSQGKQISETNFFQIVYNEDTLMASDFNVDKDNHLYSLRYAYNKDASDGNFNRDADIYLEKYATSGERLWRHMIFQKNRNPEVTSLSLDENGNPYTRFLQFTGFGYEQYIAKYDVNGEQVWIKQVTFDNEDSLGEQIEVDQGGNIYMYGGKVIARNPVSDTSGEPIADSDRVLRKFNTDGNLVWTKIFGEGVKERDYSRGIVINQNRIALLSANSFYDFPEDGKKFSLLDIDGNELWSKRASDIPNVDTMHKIALDNDNNLFTVSYPHSSLEISNKALYIIDSFDDEGNRK
jgi:hypothetical protein